jgi:predicted nicotinamide N-methyase
MNLVRERQMDALPITVVRNTILKAGAYPQLSEVRAALNGANDE